MPIKVFGSMLLSVAETASKPYLVMGLCQKIYRLELIDWLLRNRPSKDLWNGTLVLYACSKDLHNGTHSVMPMTIGRKADWKLAPMSTYSDLRKFSSEIAWQLAVEWRGCHSVFHRIPMQQYGHRSLWSEIIRCRKCDVLPYSYWKLRMWLRAKFQWQRWNLQTQ